MWVNNLKTGGNRGMMVGIVFTGLVIYEQKKYLRFT